jgi:hypothetical protein
MTSLAKSTYSNSSYMSILELDISNHKHFRWLHSLPSFFKILETLWNIVVLDKEA